MASWASWKELERAVVRRNGVLSVSGEDLRRLHGAARIGVDVQNQIETSLETVGLRVDWPGRFYSESLVRVYKEETPAAEIIEAVNVVGDAADAVIRRWTNGAAGRIARIKRILEEDD